MSRITADLYEVLYGGQVWAAGWCGVVIGHGQHRHVVQQGQQQYVTWLQHLPRDKNQDHQWKAGDNRCVTFLPDDLFLSGYLIIDENEQREERDDHDGAGHAVQDVRPDSFAPELRLTTHVELCRPISFYALHIKVIQDQTEADTRKEAYLSRLKTRRASITAARMGPSPGSSTIRSALHLREPTNSGSRFRCWIVHFEAAVTGTSEVSTRSATLSFMHLAASCAPCVAMATLACAIAALS